MSVPFSPLFEYPSLRRIEVNGKRQYVCPNGQSVPSVTTILDLTKSLESVAALIAWRARVGEAAADLKVKTACDIGTLLHSYLEKFLIGDVTAENAKTNLIHRNVKRMAATMIEKGLSKLSSYQGTEISLYYPGLYAGTADLLATYENELTILDFKNSEKIKKAEWVEDYYMQCCAYALDHNEFFGTKIRKVVILMVTRPRFDHLDDPIEFHEFVLAGKQFDEYEIKWIERVEQYYKLVSQIDK